MIFKRGEFTYFYDHDERKYRHSSDDYWWKWEEYMTTPDGDNKWDMEYLPEEYREWLPEW